MTTNIGAPFIPPDNSGISVNASGQLQLKPGTLGDLMHAGALGAWGSLPMGSALQQLRVNAGGTDLEYATIPTPEWLLLDTKTLSGVTNITSSALPANGMYKIVLNLTAMSGADTLKLQFNSDTGANYKNTGFNWTNTTTATLVASTGDTAVLLCSGAKAAGTIAGEILIKGKSPSVASGVVNVAMNICSGDSFDTGYAIYNKALWIAGNGTQLSAIKLFTSGGSVTMTGTMLVYGRSDV